MWNTDAETLTIKAIGEVESNLNYGAINYNDPITVGVAQWFGTRAAGLLSDMADSDPTGWQNVDASIRDQVDNTSNTSSYWNTRYLSPAEGSSIRTFILNNKDVQNQLFRSDIDDYVAVLNNLGFDVDAATDAAIFACTVYHQSPQAARQVISVTGLRPSLDRIHRAALNNGIVGTYRNRQNEVKAIIEAGDTTGVDDPPPDDPPDDNTGGEGGEPGERLRSSISYITAHGDNLHIHQRGESTVIPAYPSTANRWILSLDPNTGAPVDDGPDPEPEPDPPTGTGSELVQWMLDHEGEFYYTRGPAREEPHNTGGADCSSVTRQAFLDVSGVNIGSYTVAQWQNDRGTRIQSGSSGEYPDPSLLQPGDLMFSLTGWSGRGSVDHVDMIIDGQNLIGHTGNPTYGPVQRDIQAFLDWPNTTDWYVHRFVG